MACDTAMHLGKGHFHYWFNWGIWQKFQNIIFELIMQNGSLGTDCIIVVNWMPQNVTNEQVNIDSGKGLVPSGYKLLL